MATNIPQDDFQKTALRLPKSLHAQIHAAAAESGRSYNSEIVNRLEATFKADSNVLDIANMIDLREMLRRNLKAANDRADAAVRELDELREALKASPQSSFNPLDQRNEQLIALVNKAVDARIEEIASRGAAAGIPKVKP